VFCQISTGTSGYRVVNYVEYVQVEKTCSN